ncbi:retrovirus-related pol polyprotein from transposon TNT 1-94 [Tanacetum coccineum]
MFDAIHDLCVSDYLNDVNARVKSKSVKSRSAKSKKKKMWKPTGKVYTNVGYSWKPIGWIFTIDGNTCPLTRIISTKVVPPRKSNSTTIVKQTQQSSNKSGKLKEITNVGSSSKSKTIGSKISNHSEPMQNWGSNVSTVPSYSRVNFRFGNNQIEKIMGYGDYQLGNVTLSRVYYVEGLGQNLFSVGQFYDSDLEIGAPGRAAKLLLQLLAWNYSNALRLKSGYGTEGLPKLKFKKDHLCSACFLGKIKKSSHKPKADETNQEKLYLLHMNLCGPMRVESINGKKYILVIVDDYSRFTWVKVLRSKDEAPKVIIKCLKQIQVRMNATVRNIRTGNGTEFVNQTLKDYYENVGISHQTFVARTPQQNVVVKRRNRTLVEAARTMLIFSKALLFLWAQAVYTACYTQNRSLIRLHYNKTPYKLMHEKKPDLSFLHVAGSLCYPTNDMRTWVN